MIPTEIAIMVAISSTKLHATLKSMSIRSLALSTLIILMSAANGANASSTAAHPNILLIQLEHIGFMGLGPYGGVSSTPTISSLAKNGTMFANYYTSPVDSANEAMLLTGQASDQVGVNSKPVKSGSVDNDFNWKDGQKTLATRLKSAGYQTFAVGQWLLDAPDSIAVSRAGFEHTYLTATKRDMNTSLVWYKGGQLVRSAKSASASDVNEVAVDNLLSYLQTMNQSRPFFGFLSLSSSIPKPSSVPDYNSVFSVGWEQLRQQQLEKARDLGLVPYSTVLSPNAVPYKAWRDYTKSEQLDWAHRMALYTGQIDATDAQIAKVLDYLRGRKILQNTVVVIVSTSGVNTSIFDAEANPSLRAGMMAGCASVMAGPLKQYKPDMGDAGLRAPLIISGPGVNKNFLTHAHVHVADITPTLLDLAAVEYKNTGLYGQSEIAVLKGIASDVWQTQAFVFTVGNSVVVYKDNWKLIRVGSGGHWALYDLFNDAGEAQDLSDDEPDVVENLRMEFERQSQP